MRVADPKDTKRRERERERTLMLLKHTAIANTNHNPISSQISMNPYTLLILVPRVLCPTFNKELQARGKILNQENGILLGKWHNIPTTE